MSTIGKLNFLSITSVCKVFLSLEMERRLVQTKLYYKRKYAVITCNVISSEEYFIGGNLVNILCCYF